MEQERYERIAEMVNETITGTKVEGGGAAGPWVSTPLVGGLTAWWGHDDELWYASVYEADGNPGPDGVESDAAATADDVTVAAAIVRAVIGANEELLTAAGQLNLEQE